VYKKKKKPTIYVGQQIVSIRALILKLLVSSLAIRKNYPGWGRRRGAVIPCGYVRTAKQKPAKVPKCLGLHSGEGYVNPRMHHQFKDMHPKAP
jgi:hypothetical protein